MQSPVSDAPKDSDSQRMHTNGPADLDEHIIHIMRQFIDLHVFSI